MARRNHRDRVRAKAHAGILASFQASFYCHGCRRDHTHRLRVYGMSDQHHLESPARIVRKWRRAEKRNKHERERAARAMGVNPEPHDPLPPLSIADWRRIAKRRGRKAS